MTTKEKVAAKILEKGNEFIYEVGLAAYSPAADQNSDLKIGVGLDENDELFITDHYMGFEPDLMEFSSIGDQALKNWDEDYDSDNEEIAKEVLEYYISECWVEAETTNLQVFLEEQAQML